MTGLARATVFRDFATLREIGATQTLEDEMIWMPMDDPCEHNESTEVEHSESTTVTKESTTVDLSSYTEVTEFSPEVERLCNLLADHIRDFDPDGFRPAVIPKWRKDMDLLIRRGPTGVQGVPSDWNAARVERGIRRIFTELVTPTNGSNFCWAGVIESPEGLRNKWTKVGKALKGRRVMIDDGYGNLTRDYDAEN